MKEKNKKLTYLIVAIICTLVFGFCLGYYVHYRVTPKKGKTKAEIIQEIMTNEWYYGIDDEDIATTISNNMILGMMDMQKDPFTRYLTSLGTLSDTFQGVGVSLRRYGDNYIISEVSSSGAIGSGVQVGDVLLKVNDVSVGDKTTDEISALISSGTSAKLTILRGTEEKELTAPVGSYNPLTVFCKNYAQAGYARITRFALDTASKLDACLDTLPVNQEKLIIDLRGNPGGYIYSVRDCLNLLLDRGSLVLVTKDKHGNEERVFTNADKKYNFTKIVVMIDDMSASGAEAFAASINYHLNDSVTLYGETTYGKGSAQVTITFSDGTYFHYTYALWYTPAGVTINHVGVAAEVSDINTGISSLSLVNEDYKLYDYGSGVEALQKFLTMEGYYSEAIHSFFDEDVEAALSNFQSDYGIEVTGKYDTKTRNLISKLVYDDEVDYLNNELDTVLGAI